MSIPMRREDDTDEPPPAPEITDAVTPPIETAIPRASPVEGDVAGKDMRGTALEIALTDLEIALMSIPMRGEDDTDESPPAPEITDAAIPPIEPAIPRASPVEGDVAGEDMRGAGPEPSAIAPPTAPEIALMSIPMRREDDTDEPPPAPEITDAATPPIEPAIPRASPVEGDVAGEDVRGADPEPSAIAPPTALEIAIMSIFRCDAKTHTDESPPAPEITDAATPPIEPAIPRASPVEGDVAGEDVRGAGPEPSAIAPPTALEIAPAAAARSVEGPNIDVLPPAVRPVEANIALQKHGARAAAAVVDRRTVISLQPNCSRWPRRRCVDASQFGPHP